MRHEDHRPDHNRFDPRSFAAMWLPVIVALGIMVTGAVSTFLVLQADAFRPGVGDIVAFQPGSQDPDMWHVDVAATKLSPSGQVVGTCSLNPNVIAEKGGSVVVEGLRQTPDLLYRVHWAGAASTRTGTDCGTSAEVLLTRAGLQRLANAAGGFGTVGHKDALN